jgi:hypothetical protein
MRLLEQRGALLDFGSKDLPRAGLKQGGTHFPAKVLQAIHNLTREIV